MLLIGIDIMLKDQAAVEFIITYAWAILVISLFVVLVLIISDTRPPQDYLQSSCSIQPLLPCTESLLSYNSINPLQYYVVFTNQLGSIIYFPPNAISISTSNIGGSSTYSNTGNCTPDFAAQGSTVLCRSRINGASKPGPGTQAIVNFVLSYRICPTSNVVKCSPGNYISSGYSVQSVAPVSININYVTFVIKPSGNIVLNGVTYFNNTSAYLISGNYIIFAQPGQGLMYSNTLWSLNSAGSGIVNVHSQNTTLILNSNEILTAQFS